VKTYHFDQGTPEWYAARLGIPTASEFSRIITAAKGDISKSAPKYAHQLVAETLLGRPIEKPTVNSWAMQRGKELEPLARAAYAEAHKVTVDQVGFVTTDCGRIGCSPDGLVRGIRRGLEIKCVLDDSHVGIWADGPGDDYKQQIQGSMAIAELDEWDLWAWHPELPPVLIRTTRDEPYITKMRGALTEFLKIRDAMLARARETNWRPRPAQPVPATFAALKVAA
jgi:hypothetical protein